MSKMDVRADKKMARPRQATQGIAPLFGAEENRLSTIFFPLWGESTGVLFFERLKGCQFSQFAKIVVWLIKPSSGERTLQGGSRTPD